jgi:hypothetical protein
VIGGTTSLTAAFLDDLRSAGSDTLIMAINERNAVQKPGF